ncbi:MAG TPA: HAD domain-containing protein [Vicinamibacteria bacterium]|nr:HAD domain-containing protein [Vicinamibacteria bacterium]
MVHSPNPNHTALRVGADPWAAFYDMIVFLDLDGVLRRENAPKYRLEAPLVARFEDLLYELPEIEVVISSTWRDTFGIQELRGLFSADVRLRIVAKTRTIPGLNEYPRQAEAEAWLREHAPDAPWIAVDHRPDLWRPGAPVVACDPSEGLTDTACSRLRAHIRNRARNRDLVK